MQCDEIHALLAEKLAGRLADKLSETVQAYVRMHVLSCPDCCEQLDDFEEMQTLFRLLPMEACNSDAMRSRFKHFIADEEAKLYHASVRTVMGQLSPLAARWWPVVAGLTLLVVLAGIVTVVNARRTMSPQVAPVTIAPVPIPAAVTSEPLVESVEPPVIVPAEPVEIAKPVDTRAVPSPPPSTLLSVNLILDTGERLPYKPDTSIVFTDAEGRVRIPAAPLVGNLFQALVPPDGSYSISVSNVASGYAILSVTSGTTDLMNGGRITPGDNGSATIKVVVTLRKQ